MKHKIFALALAIITFSACNKKESNPNVLRVGIATGPEQNLAEAAKKVAKEKYGLDVELVTFNDYVLPNEALSKGDIVAPRHGGPQVEAGFGRRERHDRRKNLGDSAEFLAVGVTVGAHVGFVLPGSDGGVLQGQ